MSNAHRSNAETTSACCTFRADQFDARKQKFVAVVPVILVAQFVANASDAGTSFARPDKFVVSTRPVDDRIAVSG